MNNQFGGMSQPPPQPPPGPPMQPQQYGGPAPGPLPQPAPHSSGCGLKGCVIGCLVVFALFVAAVAGFGWYGYKWVKNTVFEDSLITLKAPELSEERQRALTQKIAPVKEAFNNNTGEIIELTLTQDELNWLLYYGGEGDTEPIEGDYAMGFVFPEDGVMSFSVGFSVAGEGKSGPPYVNMEGQAEFEVVEGKVTAKILVGRVGKYHVSEALLEEINQNLSEELQNNPDITPYWDRLAGAQIETGEVHLKLRALKFSGENYAEKEQE